ncbi:MAG: HAD-IA family hydrolase [Pseudomonadota bacterium]
MPKGTVIFDLDGTLADTSGDLIAAANAALVGLGHAPQLVHGPDNATAVRGGRAMLRLAFERLTIPEAAAVEQIEAGYPLLLEAYGAAIDVYTRFYPGALDAVNSLKEKDFKVGICTNKPEALADLLLVRLGVRDLFGSLIGADTLPTRKPDPRPYYAAVERAGGHVARSLLVGDTETDRHTAQAASVPCILVGFGGDVTALAPEGIIRDYAELGPAVLRLLGN